MKFEWDQIREQIQELHNADEKKPEVTQKLNKRLDELMKAMGVYIVVAAVVL